MQKGTARTQLLQQERQLVAKIKRSNNKKKLKRLEAQLSSVRRKLGLR
jgi:hypothetical protein